MIRYVKGEEPPALTAWRATPNATWESVTSAALHEALVRDQGSLCAYCERRIEMGPGMHVEPWHPRSTHHDQQLRWRNLVGVCSGTTLGHRHCDASRGNRPLFLHPVDGEGPSPLQHLHYRNDGQVSASDPRAAQDVETLRLNCEPLRRGREAVLDSLRARLRKRGFSSREFRDLYRRHADSVGSRRPEHAEVVRSLLRRWATKRQISI